MLRISTRLAGVIVLALLVVWAFSPQQTVAQAPQAAGVIAMTNARLIDGTGRPAVERATIVIRNGRIEAAGASAAVPAGAVRMDMAGKTVMPGMINAHGHAQKGLDPKVPVREDLIRQLRMYANYGVTTVMSL